MRTKQPPTRRRPKQQRSRLTFEAVLDAVARILKRQGASAVTTNRIAKVAGVSIGSVYQYFPDKRAIYRALRDRHLGQMARMIENQLVAHAETSLEAQMRGLIDAMIDAHALDPALYALLLAQAPPEGPEHGDFDSRLRGALRLAIGSRAHEFERPPELERMLFVLPQLLEALAHGAVLRRPAGLSLLVAKEEAARAVLGYLHVHGRTRARATTGRPRRAAAAARRR